MERREIFTRDVCECSIVDGVATVSVQSGTKRIDITMRVSTLIANMAACTAALAEWDERQAAEIAQLSKRGPMFLREKHD